MQTQNAYWFLGDLVIIYLSGQETGGRFSLLEWLQPPGEITPLHVHRQADQTYYVLEGELTLYLPGTALAIGPGECGYGPMNVPHTEHVTSSGPVRLVEVNSPAGFEDFIATVGEPTAELTLPPSSDEESDIEWLAGIATEHHIDVLGPPGALP
jgi:mannose-6-phosphate isomerase-like protein (cupin superfamily)